MSQTPRTHLKINPELCGEIVSLQEGQAEVSLLGTQAMVADEQGLIHGGFIFGLADYAAMLAVNDPFVVLGAAETRFIAPVRLGDQVIVRAALRTDDPDANRGKRRLVDTVGTVDGREVFRGVFTTFVLDKHVLDS